MEATQDMGALARELFNEALGTCDPRKFGEARPNDAIVLATRGTRTIYIEESWGPAIPYHAVQHEDGTRNHGYRPVKGDRDAIEAIPEVQGYPELADFLIAINASDTPIESVGCEKLQEEAVHEQQTIVSVSCYVDVIFSDLSANDDPHRHLQLAARLAAALEGCEQWWTGLELGLQRLRGWSGSVAPWGLLVRVNSAGRTAVQARQMWRHSLQCLARAIGRT
ncbi:hypothetical protein [Burkholderia vietnamiensis]|uniref:hypothetical protein n=1 Tax=Burkholderia vietnamiensis TaxID=60552 RepID=UPI001B96F0B0|nr:hypothetical protein [Burkholderia vietnamiensis]MBR8279097.1 hypothetical protein [Burkholderia vietnamiensis]